MLFNRPITCLFPQRAEPAPTELREQLSKRQQNMTDYHNMLSHEVTLGHEVRILDKENKNWCPGNVIQKCPKPWSYIVQTPNETYVQRNCSHLRDMAIDPLKKTQSDWSSNQYLKVTPSLVARIDRWCKMITVLQLRTQQTLEGKHDKGESYKNN